MQSLEKDEKSISKLSNLLNKIQLKASNNKPLKKELQKGMNNLQNTIIAFNKIASNQGAGTPGIDNKTINKFTIEEIEKIHDEYVNNKYIPKPVKRINIPKKNNNETRPLGIPTIKDRIIQQAMLQILNPFYENIFSEWSFGFRQGKSCHDALKRAEQRFKGIDWILKIDIKGFFDNINHNILLEMLKKRIKKVKTLKTIKDWLEAGLIENGNYGKTYSGSPQGGIVSPLLANIYLDYLDHRINELITEGKPRKRDNPEYWRLWRNKEHKKNNNIKSQINSNPKPRVEYIRYADDFIVGIQGNRQQAEEIKKTIETWITEDLNLEIASGKSKIVKASLGVKFLTYILRVNQPGKEKTFKKTLNGQTRLIIPKDEIDTKIKDNKWKNYNKVTHNETLASRDLLEIIRFYLTTVCGILRYFAYGSNLTQLNKLYCYAEYSCLKTIARKQTCSLAKIRKKLNYKTKKSNTWGVKYKDKGKIKCEVWPKLDWNSFKKMRNYQKQDNLDLIPNSMKFLGRTHLTDRLKAENCELCKKTYKDERLEIHHKKTIRNKNWQSILNKETMVLCRTCHRIKTNQQIKCFKQETTNNRINK